MHNVGSYGTSMEGCYTIIVLTTKLQVLTPTVRTLSGQANVHYTMLLVMGQKSPYHLQVIVAASKNQEVVRYFIDEQHCDPMTRDDNGDTPLHIACNCNHTHILCNTYCPLVKWTHWLRTRMAKLQCSMWL